MTDLPDRFERPDERPPLWEFGYAVGCATLFLILAGTSFLYKSMIGDTMLHYRTGEWALGRGWQADDPLGWDGTMPVSALNVLADRTARALGAPAAGENFPLAEIHNAFWASAPTMLLGALMVLLVWFAARRWFGREAALLAGAFAAVEPNLLANSRWITTDIPAAFSFFAGLITIALYAENATRRRFYLMAAVIALAQLCKITNLLLPAAACSVILWRSWMDQRELIPAFKRAAAQLIVLIGFTLITLHGGYAGFDQDYRMAIELDSGGPEHWAAPLWALRPLVPAPYTWTISQARIHNYLGHWSFFMGEHYQHGDWRYFPVAVLIKTPLPILLFFIAGLVFWKRIPAAIFFIGGVSFLYFFYFMVFVKVNIGVRHVLPIYPVMLTLAGYGAACLCGLLPTVRNRMIAMALSAAWPLTIAILVFPHYTSYFNITIGGSYEGWKYLSDSNVDFDQDRDFVNRFAEENWPVTIHPGDPQTKGLIIIRALMLNGISTEHAQHMAWLRENHEPIARPRPALFVYNIED